MKRQELVKRKRTKARNRRKDFVKKKNIRRNNTPVPTKKEIVPILQSIRNEDGCIEFNEKGKAKYKIIGEKTVIAKFSIPLLSPGDGILPKNKKFKNKKNEKTS